MRKPKLYFYNETLIEEKGILRKLSSEYNLNFKGILRIGNEINLIVNQTDECTLITPYKDVKDSLHLPETIKRMKQFLQEQSR